MFAKSYYTMRNILRDVAEGRELTSGQVEFVQQKLAQDAERDKARAILRKQRREGFEREIMEILEVSPNAGFTATDIQFSIPDFVRRRITNQKVSAYLHCMIEDGKVKRACFRNGLSVFYCGDELTGLYSGRPLPSCRYC